MSGIQAWNAPVDNQFMTSLSSEDLKRVQRWMRLVDLTEKRTLHWAREPIQQVYFPITTVLSLMEVLSSGSTMELGLIGNEGVSDVSVILGYNVAQFDTVVRIPGIAYLIPAVVIANEMHGAEILRWDSQLYLHHYALALMTQVAHRISCTGHHTIQQRLAGYLLMLRDRIGPGEVRLTHETLAQALGTGRPSVTLSIDSLQQAAIVQLCRGSITVRDWQALEVTACECYRNIRDDYQRILH